MDSLADFEAKAAMETLQFPSFETVTRKPTGMAVPDAFESAEHGPTTVEEAVVVTVTVVVVEGVTVVVCWPLEPTKKPTPAPASITATSTTATTSFLMPQRVAS